MRVGPYVTIALLCLAVANPAAGQIAFTDIQDLGNNVERGTTAFTTPDAYQLYAEANFNTSNFNSKRPDLWNQLYRYDTAGRDLSERLPAMIFVHGGGWVNGQPNAFEPQSIHLAQRGMVAFSIGYGLRINPGVLSAGDPGQYAVEAMADTNLALQWVRDNAVELGVDPNELYIAGGSAGGHLAAMSQLGTPSSLDVSGVALFNPVISTASNGFGYNALRNHYGSSFDPLTISPHHQLEAGMPPVLIQHGTADTTVPFARAAEFQAASQALGNTVDLIAYEGAAHAFFNNSPYLEQTTQALDDWLVDLGALPSNAAPGDLDEDGDVDPADVDLLIAAHGQSAPPVSARYDFIADGVIVGRTGEADSDLTEMIRETIDTELGDTNLDKLVSLIDLNLLGANFGQPAGWGGGDFNGDGVVTLVDLNTLGTHFGFNNTGVFAPAVPEPSGIMLLALGFLLIKRQPKPD